MLDYFEHNYIDFLFSLSAIEHFWFIMCRQLLNLLYNSQILAALCHETQITWDDIFQDKIEHLLEVCI